MDSSVCTSKNNSPSHSLTSGKKLATSLGGGGTAKANSFHPSNTIIVVNSNNNNSTNNLEVLLSKPPDDNAIMELAGIPDNELSLPPPLQHFKTTSTTASITVSEADTNKPVMIFSSSSDPSTIMVVNLCRTNLPLEISVWIQIFHLIII